MRVPSTSALLLLLLLLAIPDLGRAEAYSYVDENGRLYFTDSIHGVPARFRAEAKPVAEEVDEEEAGVSDVIGAHRRSMTKWLLGTIAGVRQAQGTRGLTHRQKRDFSALVRTWTPIGLSGLVALGVVTLVVVVHGFMNGLHFWAVANLIFLGIPAGAYSFRHVGERNAAVKFTASILAIAPLLALFGLLFTLGHAANLHLGGR